MAIADHTITDMDQIDLAPTGIVAVRDRDGRPVITATQELRAAGVDGPAALEIIETEHELDELVVGQIRDRESDDTLPPDTSAIIEEGNPNASSSLTITMTDVLDELGIDAPDADTPPSERPRLLIRSGDGHIAFQHAGSPRRLAAPTDADADHIHVRPRELATLRYHNGSVEMTPTASFREAGLDSRGAYVPLSGVGESDQEIVARVLDLGASETPPEGGRTISKEGDRVDNPRLTTRISQDLLEDLGYDVDAIRDGERPEILVWSGEGYVAFEHPGNDITINLPERAPDGTHLSPTSRQDLLHVYQQTEGDLEEAADMLGVTPAEAEDYFDEAGLLDLDV